MSHTPTPWKLADRGHAAIEGPRGPQGRNYVVANCGGFSSSAWDAIEENEANAAFIVKAVNAYDEMVTLLSEVRKWMDADEFGPWEAKLCERIDAALSKAGASQ